MKLISGILMCIAGAALGLYVGGWVCFIGGIVDVINQIKADDVEALAVAIGIGKVLFAGFFGWLSAACLIVPGAALIGTSN